MENINLFRRRYIPNEIVHLKEDIILYQNKDKIITRWATIKPRKDFSHGVSLYLINKNYKISKFFNSNNKCIYIYCDIIETIFNCDKNEFIFNDLLADIKIYNDGKIEILDLAEIPLALEENLITQKQLSLCLTSLDDLLSKIYNNRVEEYIHELDKYID